MLKIEVNVTWISDFQKQQRIEVDVHLTVVHTHIYAAFPYLRTIFRGKVKAVKVTKDSYLDESYNEIGCNII